MRIVKLFTTLAIVLLGTTATADAATQRRQGPVLLHLKWHLVSRNVNAYVIANDRYVFFVTSLQPPVGTQEGVLVDRRTGRRTSINGPCPLPQMPEEHDSGFGTPYFGGPWLMLQCADAAYLYNLHAGQWNTVAAPAGVWQDQPKCPVANTAVGTYWIRWGCELQNIYTGAVKDDPVKPGGRIYDDLNTPSGVRRLCSPLRYPRDRFALTFYNGRIAFTTDQLTGEPHHLLLCDSRFNLTMRNPPPDVGIDSQAIAWAGGTADRPLIDGMFFPDLRRFVIHPPRRSAPVALSQRTVYVQTSGLGGQLWAANLPKSP